MKILQLSFIALSCLIFLFSCEKEPEYTIELPESVEVGQSVLYLNGEKVDYVPNFFNDTIYHFMGFNFIKKEQNVANVVSFGWLPKKTGTFSLKDDSQDVVIGTDALTGFAQNLNEDLLGYSYKVMDEKDGFFTMEALDTVKMEVKGRFKAKFCRSSKNGNKENLGPKFLIFEGVYHEKYSF